MRYLRIARATLIVLLAGVILLTYHRYSLILRAKEVLALQLSALTGEKVGIEHLEADFMDMRLRVSDLKVRPYQASAPSPLLSLDSIEVTLGWLPNARGLHLREVKVVHPVIQLELKNGELETLPDLQAMLNKPSSGDGGDFKVDIDHLIVEDAQVRLLDPILGIEGQIETLNASVTLPETRPGLIWLEIRNAYFASADYDERIDYLAASADLRPTPAILRSLVLRSPDTDVDASGSFYVKEPPEGVARAQLRTHVNTSLQVLNRLVPDLPALTGALSLEAELSVGDTLTAAGTAAFDGVTVDYFGVHEGEVEFTFARDTLTVNSLALPRGEGRLEARAELGLKGRLPLSVSARLDGVELADIFEDVGLSDPWVMLLISGQVEAEGFLTGPFRLNTHLDLETQAFKVFSDSFHIAREEDRIFGLTEAQLTIDATLDAKKARIDFGEIHTPRSLLQLEGFIGFDERLELLYDALELDLSELSPLAGFKLEGRGWGKGAVSGPFVDMLITARLNLADAVFDTYVLGDFEGEFVVPINGGRQLQALLSLPEEDPSLSPGMKELAQALAGDVSDKEYEGHLLELDPTIMLIPETRIRLGETRIYGRGAVIFSAITKVYGDVIIPPGPDGRPKAGNVADLITLYGTPLEDHPIDIPVSGKAVVYGDPLALFGSGSLEMEFGTFYGQHFRQGALSFRLEQGSLIASPLKITTGQGDLFLEGTMGPLGELDVTALVKHLPLSEVDSLRTLPLEGRADVVLTLGGDLDHPTFFGTLEVKDAFYDGTWLGNSVLTLDTEEESLLARGLLLEGQARLDATILLKDTSPWSATLEVRDFSLLPFLGLAPDIVQLSRCTLGGVVWARGDLAEQSPILVMQVDSFLFSSSGQSLANAEAITLELRNGEFSLPPARLTGEGTDLTIEGSIQDSGEVAFDIFGSLNLFFPGLLLPDVFQRLEGTMLFKSSTPSEQAFHVGGSTEAVHLDGKLELKEAAFNATAFPVTIDQVSASVLLKDDNTVRIASLFGHIGGGTLRGGGLLVLGDDFTPTFYDLEVDAKDAFIRYPDFMPPGMMDGAFKFYGNAQKLLLSGDLDLKRMVYRDRFDWEKYLTDFRTYRLENLELPSNEPSYFDIDIRIHAPGTFFLNNNIGQVQFQGDLQLMGDTNVMSLYGTAESERGTVNLLDNTFEVAKAVVSFRGDYWNPALDIRIETQIQSYTIFYEITGTVNDWRLTPGSDSGLSERDINSLIAFGTLADNLTEGNEIRAVAAPAFEFLMGRLGILEQIQAITRLDRVTLVPATDELGNVGVRLYGEKELVPQKLFFSGYYDYSFSGSHQFQTDLEWRTLSCCSVILRLDNDKSTGSGEFRPGARLKLKLELE